MGSPVRGAVPGAAGRRDRADGWVIQGLDEGGPAGGRPHGVPGLRVRPVTAWADPVLSG